MGRTPRIPRQLTLRPFTLNEARAAGITLSALRGKSWQRLGSRLYRWTGRGEDTWGVINACRRLLPSSAVFVGRTAAWMHGLDVEATNPVQVAMSGDCRSMTGVQVVQSDAEGESVSIKGLRATRIERTLLDMCVLSSRVEALIALDMATAGRLIDKQTLLRYADATQGRPGAARLRRLASVAAPAESPMETRLRWLLIQGGLPIPEVQSDLHDDGGEFVGRADLYYPSARLVIEFDGGNHRTRLVADDRRQNSIVDAGYRILRFTSADVYARPDAVVALVRGYLSGR